MMLNIKRCCLNAGATFCQRTFRTTGTTDTHYDTHGIKRSATQADVKEAYIRLCKEYHPDTHSNDEHKGKKFLKISDAYTTLSNTQYRTEYDTHLSSHGCPNDFGRRPSAYKKPPYASQGKAWDEMGHDEYNSDFYRRYSDYRYQDNFYGNKRTSRSGRQTHVNSDPGLGIVSQLARISFLFLFFPLIVSCVYETSRSQKNRRAMEDTEA